MSIETGFFTEVARPRYLGIYDRAIIAQKRLFDPDTSGEIETSPRGRGLRLPTGIGCPDASGVLEAIPNEPLMHTLERERKQRRDGYPIRAVWNSVLAGIVFQHESVASLRRELCRFQDTDNATENYTPLAFEGFEADRLARKYRCSRRVGTRGIACTQKDFCNGGCHSAWGRIVANSQSLTDSVGHGPMHLHRWRDCRTSGNGSMIIGRRWNPDTSGNSRIDNVFGFEHRYIRGQKS